MAKKNKKVISNQELIDDIINTAKKAKSIPTRSQYRRFGKHASSTVEDRFSNWGVVARKLKATQFSWSK
jgi:hypothetical protein